VIDSLCFSPTSSPFLIVESFPVLKIISIAIFGPGGGSFGKLDENYQCMEQKEV
jgi:hypothetical protein